MVERSEMATRLHEARAFVAGKRVKVDFGDAGTLMLDGVSHRVFDGDEPADATIAVSWADWLGLADGSLSPMTAFMSGRVRIAGEMGTAMQLGTILSKLG